MIVKENEVETSLLENFILGQTYDRICYVFGFIVCLCVAMNLSGLTFVFSLIGGSIYVGLRLIKKRVEQELIEKVFEDED